MSTRSNIIVQRRDGKWARVYCHYDGYVDHNGVILQNHFDDQEKAEALVALGDMSNLAPSIKKPKGHSFDNKAEGHCTFYGRDRGEIGTEPMVCDTLDEALTDYEEYAYVWKDGEWWVASYGSPLTLLVVAIAKEAMQLA